MAQSYVAFGGAETSRRLAADGQGTLASPLVPLFGFGDTAAIDAFGRLRVSAPEYVFDALSGTTTFADVNATYSAMEYNTAGTISGSPAIVLFSGYASATGGRVTAPRKVGLRYPITLNAAGAARALGTLSVLATGYTGTAPCRATMNWREVR